MTEKYFSVDMFLLFTVVALLAAIIVAAVGYEIILAEYREESQEVYSEDFFSERMSCNQQITYIKEQNCIDDVLVPDLQQPPPQEPEKETPCRKWVCEEVGNTIYCKTKTQYTETCSQGAE